MRDNSFFSISDYLRVKAFSDLMGIFGTLFVDSQFTPFPTYPVVLSLKGTSQDIVDFTTAHKAGKVIPGLLAFDVKRVVSRYKTSVSRPFVYFSDRYTVIKRYKCSDLYQPLVGRVGS